jgi:hypothetical protein
MKHAETGVARPELDPKESAELLGLLADPELQKYMVDSKNGGPSVEALGRELYWDLLEELGVHLSEAQASQFQQLFQGLEARGKALDPDTATAVDQRIAEVAATREFAEKFAAILTAEQRENARCLLRMQQELGTGVQVPVESEDRTVPSLLDAWARKLIPLSEEEQARLGQAAAVHAGRLSTLETELSSQYGADFIDRFASSLASKTEWTLPADPSFDPKARDAYGRFLELERQNRLSLMSALPERTDAIRKAEANIYLLLPRKK